MDIATNDQEQLELQSARVALTPHLSGTLRLLSGKELLSPSAVKRGLSLKHLISEY